MSWQAAARWYVLVKAVVSFAVRSAAKPGEMAEVQRLMDRLLDSVEDIDCVAIFAEVDIEYIGLVARLAVAEVAVQHNTERNIVDKQLHYNQAAVVAAAAAADN